MTMSSLPLRPAAAAATPTAAAAGAVALGGAPSAASAAGFGAALREALGIPVSAPRPAAEAAASSAESAPDGADSGIEELAVPDALVIPDSLAASTGEWSTGSSPADGATPEAAVAPTDEVQVTSSAAPGTVPPGAADGARPLPFTAGLARFVDPTTGAHAVTGEAPMTAGPAPVGATGTHTSSDTQDGSPHRSAAVSMAASGSAPTTATAPVFPVPSPATRPANALATTPAEAPATAPGTAPVPRGEAPILAGSTPAGVATGAAATGFPAVPATIPAAPAPLAPAPAVVPSTGAPVVTGTSTPVGAIRAEATEPGTSGRKAVLAPGAASASSSASAFAASAVAQAVGTAPVAPTAAAVATAPAQPAVPVPFATQIARPVFTLAAAGPGEHTVTVTVTPDALGPVTVRAHLAAESMRVELFAPTDLGREALRGILGELRKDLVTSGITASLDLSSQNAPADARDARDDARRHRLPDQTDGGTGTGARSARHASDEAPRLRVLGTHSTIDVLA
ncbi:flagellar hook-length control protein FliK [Planctomonas psychrotolerans]|uniref:flagellar hook-length control protein FliK n=1 Tax=Planctomonas psychrotolerans TaxID=2528712 RepID=UPI001239046D|nr:flagellar hook-length control protein FliK [Planctomonas psychrotolerans]